MRHGNISQGTIIWNISDDNGKTHEFMINNSYLVPNGGVRLLIPQHWAREYKNKTGQGEWEMTDDSQITLIWGNGKYTRTTRLTNGSNIGNICTQEGYNTYETRLKAMQIKEDNTSNTRKEDVMKYLQEITQDTKINTLPKYDNIKMDEEHNTYMELHNRMGHIPSKLMKEWMKINNKH